jgi:hypothetical protein
LNGFAAAAAQLVASPSAGHQGAVNGQTGAPAGSQSSLVAQGAEDAGMRRLSSEEWGADDSRPGGFVSDSIAREDSEATAESGLPFDGSTYYQAGPRGMGLSQQFTGSAARPAHCSSADWGYAIAVSPTARRIRGSRIPAGQQTGVLLDLVLDQLIWASDSIPMRGYEGDGESHDQAHTSAGVVNASVPVNPAPEQSRSSESEDSDGSSGRLSGLLMAVGLIGLSAGLAPAKKPKAQGSSSQRGFFQFPPRAR